MKSEIKNLDSLISSEGYQMYESDTLLNIQYHIINTDKDIDEMLEYNEDGMFGCTHSEFIDTWREYLNTLSVFDPEYDEEEDKHTFDMDKQTYDTINAEIDKCEEYHITHNTLEEYI